MLILPDVFELTWGIRRRLFWPRATKSVRRKHSRTSCFMAEVYWDLEWTMQQQGFDYAYDKRLYDRLREGHARPVREHFCAGLRLPKQARPIPGEPRRAACRGDVSRREFTGRRGHHFSFARPAILSPRTIRGAKETDLAAPRVVARTSRSIWSSGSFMIVCWPSCASRLSAKASGNCWNAFPLGKVTGQTTASWPLPGKARDGERYSWQ